MTKKILIVLLLYAAALGIMLGLIVDSTCKCHEMREAPVETQAEATR